jgi:Asp-tRNA(Asn)/Glu-tRNA(Gln) amidotransferase A subunit family amidase
MTHSIESAAAALRRGEFTPVDLLDRCFERIDRLEERVRAWVLVDRERAREDAVRATNELKSGLDRGPLHGIPIGVKDLFDVADWPTAAGSRRWAQSIARQDCPTIARLRQAGAVLMGKTVTVAYAAFDPPPTRNPWNPDRTPGGSSSGSAAAVACGMCLAALGTQTGGSITRPASYCGVSGLKPTHGGVSLEGVVPFAPTFDHGGMLAASVRDLALSVQPILVQRGAAPGPTNYAAGIGKPVRKALGLPGAFFDRAAESGMAEAFGKLVERLRAKGWTVESTPLPPAIADVPKYHRLIMRVEGLAYHRERWQRHPDDYPPLLTELLREGTTVSAVDYEAARQHHRALRAELAASFPPGVSAYLAPATTEPPPGPTTTGPNLFQAPWSYLGVPTVSLPFAWTADGLPLCAQVAGRWFDEANLLALSAALEADIGFDRREVSV